MSYAAKAYANNQVVTDVNIANSNELILLVYEKIFENLKFGINEMDNYRYGINEFSRASDLINFGLLAVLDFEKGGEIANQLKIIYEWSLNRLLMARVNKSTEMVQEVIDTLTPLYEGWKEIIPSKPAIKLLQDLPN